MFDFGRWEQVDLERLRLGGNELNCLPEEIGHLAGLRVLDVHDNVLTSLPEAIGSLCCLSRLDLKRWEDG